MEVGGVLGALLEELLPPSRVITSPDPHLKSRDRGLSLEVSLLQCRIFTVLNMDHLVTCLELRNAFMLDRTVDTLRGSREGTTLVVHGTDMSGEHADDVLKEASVKWPWSIMRVITSSNTSTIFALWRGS